MVKNVRVLVPGKKGFLGIGKTVTQYEVDIFQQSVVELQYKPKVQIAIITPGRGSDGSILGDLISKEAYLPQAGCEPIGYFSPACAPFRTFPNGKTGLIGGTEADQQMQLRRAAWDTFGGMFSSSGNRTVDMVVRLCDKLAFISTSFISGSQSALETLPKELNEGSTGDFLLVTTSMPFFLTYSKRQPTVVAEVDLELKLNALANLLLNDPAFKGITCLKDFSDNLKTLMTDRKEEFEAKKQWAIEFQKSRKA